jgi:ribulose-phosphate 3-epimerase
MRNKKMKIIPGILARSKAEFQEQAKRVAWAPRVHIDVIDGLFVPKKTVALPRKGAQFHLMVIDARKYLKGEEVIMHAESHHPLEAMRFAKKHRMRVGIAFNLSTKVRADLVKAADFALVMAVKPGASGQMMRRVALKKVKQIKRIKRIPVGVDGGVNNSTILYAKKAGADFVIATSAVTLSKNPRKEYDLLKNMMS